MDTEPGVIMSATPRQATRWWSLAAVALATFVTSLDNTVVNVALPSIQRDLRLSIAGLEWVASAYILVFASLLLAGGRLADRYGRRRLFLIGLALFTGASLLAGLAGTGPALIAARAVQGVGAALLAPTTLAIISTAFPRERERNLAVAAWSAIAALALALGPLVGGLLAQHWHWSWIFFINVPVGVLTLAVGRLAIGESRADATDGGRIADPGRDRRGGVRRDRGPGTGAHGRRVAVPRPGVHRRHRRDGAVGPRRDGRVLLHLPVPAGHPGLLAHHRRGGVRTFGAADGRRRPPRVRPNPAHRRQPHRRRRVRAGRRRAAGGLPARRRHRAGRPDARLRAGRHRLRTDPAADRQHPRRPADRPGRRRLRHPQRRPRGLRPARRHRDRRDPHHPAGHRPRPRRHPHPGLPRRLHHRPGRRRRAHARRCGADPARPRPPARCDPVAARTHPRRTRAGHLTTGHASTARAGRLTLRSRRFTRRGLRADRAQTTGGRGSREPNVA